MSSNTFNKETLDIYLKELSKEFRRLNGKTMPAEIILVGGSAIVANYGFREMTTDVDAIIRASSAMQEAINHVRDKYELPHGWLNQDFLKTDSFSSKLIQFSRPYRRLANGLLEVRVVSAEHLVAMKLRAGRKYKHDLSDAVGILSEHEKNGSPITMAALRKAVQDLYGEWEALPSDSRDFIEDAFQKGNYEALYATVCEEEKSAKDTLVEFEKDYPGVTNTANVNDILATLQEKKMQSLDETIQECKDQQTQNTRTGRHSPQPKNER